jgi:hypothetical protein
VSDLAKLTAHAAHLEDLLQRCAEFIEPYSDVVDGDSGYPAPNAAMSLLSAISDALG